ncbi:NAD-dependent dehydratase [Nesterenkonia muleiensis]|uniref:NAD-dependent dehydratase n=1 Tax=Nesterenkonia muleiensis TaxID=2282648 RepID=UPI000E757B58|nr:NAD-dependent dehydratase [Nesterenkonia muleiensis]
MSSPATGHPASQRVLLAGCGDLNTQVGLRLHAQGHHVTAVRRSSEQRCLPFPVRQLDLAAAGAGPGSVPGTETLPEADAVVVALTADSSDAEGYTRAYRNTLHGLVSALPRAPERVIFVSSTSVLGEHDGAVVTEQSVPAPQRETAQVLLAAEQDAVQLFDGAVVLRPAGIYGPGRHRTVERVLRGDGADHGRITNRIHRDDLVTTILALLKAERPPRLLHAVDAEPAPLGEVLRYLAAELGVPVPPDTGSGTPVGKSIDAAALHRLLGPGGLRYPSFREGYAPLLAAYRGCAD